MESFPIFSIKSMGDSLFREYISISSKLVVGSSKLVVGSSNLFVPK